MSPDRYTILTRAPIFMLLILGCIAERLDSPLVTMLHRGFAGILLVVFGGLFIRSVKEWLRERRAMREQEEE